MIIIDTLARNFGAGNENSTEDMNAFVERVDDLKNTFNSCICLVHHTGHGSSNRARGSSVLPAAVDWEYKVSRHQHSCHAKQTDLGKQTSIHRMVRRRNRTRITLD